MADFKQNYFQRRTKDRGPKSNNRISSPEVQVIDSKGDNLGILNTNEAIAMAKEEGLDTCAQEAWSMKHDSVSEFVQADSNDMLFCGMSIGYEDTADPINSLKSKRRPLAEWAKFI